MEGSTHQACAPCRTHKTRCLPSHTKPSTCQRCERYGKDCIFTTVQKRRPRRMQNTRIAELEKEMREMRALLRQQDQHPAAAFGSSSSAHVGETPETLVVSLLRSTASSPVSAAFPRHLSPGGSLDVVSAGLISLDDISTLLNHYHTLLYPHYPVVPMADIGGVESLRLEKPTLFLAIMAASLGDYKPDLARKFDQIALEQYARKIVVSGHKSLEIVQALLVSAIWFQLPGRYQQLKFYEYVQMAVSMAEDLAPRVRTRSAQVAGLARSPSAVHCSTSLHEDRYARARAVLGAYCASSFVSLTLRRQPAMKISSLVHESIAALSDSPSICLDDKLLPCWTSLATISDDIGNAFSYHDFGAVASISDQTVQSMLAGFRGRLVAWYQDSRRALADLGFSHTLLMNYSTVRVYLHEIVLYLDHSPNDFVAPYHIGPLESQTNQPGAALDLPVPIVAEAVVELMSAAHVLLDCFLSIEVESVRCLPVFAYNRINYACAILAKLYISARSPVSHIATFIDLSILKADSYILRSASHLHDAIGPNCCRTPVLFADVISRMRLWTSDSVPKSVALFEPALQEMEVRAGMPSPATLPGTPQAAYDELTGGDAFEQPTALQRSSVHEFPGGVEIDISGAPSVDVHATEFNINDAGEFDFDMFVNDDAMNGAFDVQIEDVERTSPSGTRLGP